MQTPRIGTLARSAGIALAVALALACVPAAPAGAVTLSISCGAVGQELALCRRHAQAWADRTGHEVRIVPTPNDASARLALYQQVLAARSDRIDVFQVDVVWPGMLAAHLLDLGPHARGAQAGHLPSFVANNTVDGRLVAMPWFANAGLLFYRRDLLDRYGARVPSTWQELEATARRIQEAERAAGNDRMWGYVFQGRAYEGLTCNAYEWVVSHGGGTIVEPDGRVSIRNPRAAAALRRAASWVGTISPTAVLNYAEEEARGVFQAGHAVFMRNWPYAWALAQAEGSPVRGKVGVARLPRGGDGDANRGAGAGASPGGGAGAGTGGSGDTDGTSAGSDSGSNGDVDVASDGAGRHAATLGGESLAVSRYTRYPAIAADLVMHLTSAAVQKERALVGAFNPTLVALYDDEEIAAANPFMRELRDVFATAVARPTAATGPRYNQVSHAFWNAVHEVLSGRAEADAALARLDRRLQRLRRGGQWR